MPWEPRLRYHTWILQQMPSPADLVRQRCAARRRSAPPLISIVTPVYNTPPEMLRRMIRSVACQSYPHWELCLVDDGSSASWMNAALARAAASDARIRVAFDAIGGFRAVEDVGCGDVDYCLRVREHPEGGRIVLTPRARLRFSHANAQPPEPSVLQRAAFHRVWGDRMRIDPYYNRNYRQDGAWFVVDVDVDADVAVAPCARNRSSTSA